MLAACVSPASSKPLMTVMGTLPGSLDSMSAARENWLVVTMQPAACGCKLPRSSATSFRPTVCNHRFAWICTSRLGIAHTAAPTLALTSIPPSWLKRVTSTRSNPVLTSRSRTNSSNRLGSNASRRFLMGSRTSIPGPEVMPASDACSGSSWSSGLSCQSLLVRARLAASWSEAMSTLVTELWMNSSNTHAFRHCPPESSCCSRLHRRNSSRPRNRQRLLSSVVARRLLT